MPDVAMCFGTNCPLKETCYRYKAKPNEYRQSYLAEPPIKEGKCEYYWKTSEDAQARSLPSVPVARKQRAKSTRS